MIPQEKRAAVERALRETFGVANYDAIQFITTGLSSAIVARIVVQGRPYLLRVITRTDAMSDPTRQFASMQAGAEAGLAPRVWYTSVEDRVSITDFVEAVPFPRTEALALIPRALRTLHALPRFPKPLVVSNYFDFVDAFIRRFRAAGILPASKTEAPLAEYARIAAAYPREDSEMVSSHNDLKPENILFDGDRVWLVDWEAAFLNDRYFDLAVVANFVVETAADERAYLQTYFQQPPDEYHLARFCLMRQVVHMAYAVVFMTLGSANADEDSVPEFRDFHRRIWAGEVDLHDDGMKALYGRVHWNRVVENLGSERVREAASIVSDRHVRV